MEESTTYDKMNSAQLTILILLLIERIAKFLVNSKCYKHLQLNLFGIKVIDLNSESEIPPISPRNNKE
jgi:hypothetical protein